MKTSRSIAEQEERKQGRGDEKKPAETPPFSAHVSAPVRTTKEAARQAAIERIRPYRLKPGKSANPGGKPKHDVAKELAKAIFEGNQELIYQAFLKALSKGNAHCFQVLADRGYGKLKEQHAVEVTPFSHMFDDELKQRIRELEEKLGVRRSGPVLLPPADNDTDRKVQ